MSPEGSVTQWINLLKAGDRDGAQHLWERYFRRLVGLARQKLQSRTRGAADEEDAALHAFASFCRGAEGGQFPRLEDRNDLWQVLVMLTARKTVQLVRRETQQKRGGGRVLREADLADGDGPALAEVIGQEPTPEFAAELADRWRQLLQRLADDEMRSIAQWKLEGHTTREIAERLGCVPRTVERRLELIRKLWEEDEA